jgi:hypothetical protein
LISLFHFFCSSASSRLAGLDHRDLEIAHLDRLRRAVGQDETLEGRVAAEGQGVEQLGELAALLDAGQDRRALGREEVAQRRRTDRRAAAGDLEVVVVQDVVE